MVQFKADHDHLSSTMSTMNKFREDSSLCDIKLIIGSQTLQAHRCVLAAGSPYFNTLFLGQFTEANMKEINLSGVTGNITALKQVMNFIYTGEIDISEENIRVITKLSSFLLIESLRTFCCTFMIENLSLDTCVGYYVLSLEHGLVEIEKQCCSLMTDNLSLATCLKYYLWSLEHGLVAIEKMAGPMVRSRFHDYLIHEDATLDISTNEMELLVERNVLQHCSNVSIFRFIARWVIKWPTKRHVLIAKSICDDLIQRENAPKMCSLQLAYKHSEDSLYEMVKSSLIEGAIGVESKEIFLKSFEQVLRKLNIENEIHIVETRSPLTVNSKEPAIVMVSKCNVSEDNDEEIRTSNTTLLKNEPIVDVWTYVPRTKCWYHIKRIYDRRFFHLKRMIVHSPYMFHLLHDDLITIELGGQKVVINDLNSLENCDSRYEYCDTQYRPYYDFVWNKAAPTSLDANDDRCVQICLIAGKDHQRYLISKTRWYGPVQDIGIKYILGTFFHVYKFNEDENTWQVLFETELFDVPTEDCDTEHNYLIDMSAHISSVSNELVVVSTGEELNIVFVVDLNKENVSPVTLLSSPMLHNDMDIGKSIDRRKIVETDDAMYIVTDGITDVRSRSGKARVRHEYKHFSNQLTTINSTVAILSHLNETSRPEDPKTIRPPWNPDMYPCPSESSAAIGDGLWYMEENNDIACFLTKVSVDSNKNPVVEHHTPPPFSSFTGMFAGKISSKMLENKKPITRFIGKE